MFLRPLFPSSLLLLLLLLLFLPVHSRFLSTSDLVSDGVHHQTGSPFLLLNPFAADESSCKQTYGFMPCTTTALGNLFLIIIYGCLMCLAAICLSSGSDQLLLILGPDIIGGLILPVLGTLPDVLPILVSGLSGTTETAQSRITIGMGLIAGSTVMFLTVTWGFCVVVGRCDLCDSVEDGKNTKVAVDETNTEGFSLTGTGVSDSTDTNESTDNNESTEKWPRCGALIMAISVIPFIVVQVPQILNSTSGRNLAILIALILSISMLVAYCLYQAFVSRIHHRRIEYKGCKHVMSAIRQTLKHCPLVTLLSNEGKPNVDVIKWLFHEFDENHDGYLSAIELKAIFKGIQFGEMDKDDAVAKIINDFDTSHDNVISEDEFIARISKWLKEAEEQTMRESERLGADGVVGHRWTSLKAVLNGVEKWLNEAKCFKAVLKLLLGVFIAAAFADPLVDAVDNFSDATSIPTFFISFIALPLATNGSEAVSAIITASHKKQETTSLAFSELYGAVIMNNLLGLSVFLALVYIRGLKWDFSSEVLVILIVCLLMSAIASFRKDPTTFPLWTCSVAFILYPFSLALVYVLDYVFGWS